MAPPSAPPRASIAGGHSIDSKEPIYGLVALGLVHPDKLLTNRTGRSGDVLILTKPLGIGIYSAALKQDRLDDAGYRAMIASTTKLNTFGKDLGQNLAVHALTDVTGFGLVGHALEMARGANLTVELTATPPLLPGVKPSPATASAPAPPPATGTAMATASRSPPISNPGAATSSPIRRPAAACSSPPIPPPPTPSSPAPAPPASRKPPSSAAWPQARHA